MTFVSNISTSTVKQREKDGSRWFRRQSNSFAAHQGVRSSVSAFQLNKTFDVCVPSARQQTPRKSCHLPWQIMAWALRLTLVLKFKIWTNGAGQIDNIVAPPLKDSEKYRAKKGRGIVQSKNCSTWSGA